MEKVKNGHVICPCCKKEYAIIHSEKIDNVKFDDSKGKAGVRTKHYLHRVKG